MYKVYIMSECTLTDKVYYLALVYLHDVTQEIQRGLGRSHSFTLQKE